MKMPAITMKGRWFLDAFLLINVLIGLLACQPNDPESNTEPQTNKPASNFTQENMSVMTQAGSPYSVLITPNLSTLPLNQYFDITVEVRSDLQKVLPYSVDLIIDAGMHAHNHGMNVKPIVERLTGNQFKITGMLFHMPGEWFIKATIKRGVMQSNIETTVNIAI